MTVTELSDLSDMLATSLDHGYTSVTVQAIVESVSGTTSNAVATVIIIVQGFDDSGKTVITSKAQFRLVKTSGEWRIRSEHWIYQNEESYTS